MAPRNINIQMRDIYAHHEMGILSASCLKDSPDVSYLIGRCGTDDTRQEECDLPDTVRSASRTMQVLASNLVTATALM